MTGILEFLIWMGIGTGGGLVIAVIFFIIARYLNARDHGKKAKTGGRSSGG
jgi:hypothetical protein